MTTEVINTEKIDQKEFDILQEENTTLKERIKELESVIEDTIYNLKHA